MENRDNRDNRDHRGNRGNRGNMDNMDNIDLDMGSMGSMDSLQLIRQNWDNTEDIDLIDDIHFKQGRDTTQLQIHLFGRKRQCTFQLAKGGHKSIDIEGKEYKLCKLIQFEADNDNDNDYVGFENSCFVKDNKLIFVDKEDKQYVYDEFVENNEYKIYRKYTTDDGNEYYMDGNDRSQEVENENTQQFYRRNELNINDEFVDVSNVEKIDTQVKIEKMCNEFTEFLINNCDSFNNTSDNDMYETAIGLLTNRFGRSTPRPRPTSKDINIDQDLLD